MRETPLSDTGTIAVTVNPVNDAPVAVDTTATTDEDTAVTVDVASLISDVDSTNLTVTASVDPLQGTVTVSGTVITFTPAANFNGPASITYTVTDDAGTPLSDTGTIAVTVNPVNDAPVAVDTTATTDEDTAVTVDVASLISDVDSTNLTVTASVDPLQGTVTVSGTVITFTPAANFNGPASITYTVTDDAGTPLSDTGTIAVTVNPVNDAPVAVDTTATTDEDTAVTVDVASLISDVDSTNLTVTASVDPLQGTVTVSGTVITFTPAANFNGPASITYTVTDDAGTPLSDTGTIAVTVNPVNDAPVAVDTTATTDEDTAVTVDVASLISDVDSTNLTVTASVDPLQGTVTVSGTVITFTPAANFNGPASITYTVTDDAGTPLSDTGTIAVTVNPVNDAPVAVDTTATTDEDTAGDGRCREPDLGC